MEGFRAGQQETTRSSGLGLSPPPHLLPAEVPPPSVSSFPPTPNPHPQPKLSLSSSSLSLSLWWAVLTRLPSSACLMVLGLLPKQTQGVPGLQARQASPRTACPVFKGELSPGGERHYLMAPRGRARVKCLDFMAVLCTRAGHWAMLRRAKPCKGLVSVTKARPGLASVQTRSCHWWNHH